MKHENYTGKVMGHIDMNDSAIDDLIQKSGWIELAMADRSLMAEATSLRTGSG